MMWLCVTHFTQIPSFYCQLVVFSNTVEIKMIIFIAYRKCPAALNTHLWYHCNLYSLGSCSLSLIKIGKIVSLISVKQYQENKSRSIWWDLWLYKCMYMDFMRSYVFYAILCQCMPSSAILLQSHAILCHPISSYVILHMPFNANLWHFNQFNLFLFISYPNLYFYL